MFYFMSTEANKLMLAGGAASNEVFNAADNIFGILPDATLYFDRSARVLASHGITRAYVVEEDEAFPRKACSPVREQFEKGETWYDMEVKAHVRLPMNTTDTERERIYLERLVPLMGSKRSMNDVLVGCVYVDTCIKLVEFLRRNNLNTDALLFTTCVHEDTFKEELLSGSDARAKGYPGRYILGASSWDQNVQTSMLPPIGLFRTGVTAEEVVQQYKFYFPGKGDPSYHVAAAFSVVQLSMVSIAAKNSTDVEVLRDFLNSIDAQTAFGRVRYVGGQNVDSDSTLTLQHDDSHERQVVVPNYAASSQIQLPKPEWALMECQVLNKCGSNGDCRSDGSCSCNFGYIGSQCDTNLTAILASIGSIFVCTLMIVIGRLVYKSRIAKKLNKEKEQRIEEGRKMATVAQDSHLRALSFINHRLRNPAHSIAGTVYMIRDSEEYESLSPNYKEKVELLQQCIMQIAGTLDEISKALDAGYGLLGNIDEQEDDTGKSVDSSLSGREMSSSPSSAPVFAGKEGQKKSDAEQSFLLADLVRDVRHNMAVSCMSADIRVQSVTVPPVNTEGSFDMMNKVDFSREERSPDLIPATVKGPRPSLMQLLGAMNVFVIQKTANIAQNAEERLDKRYDHYLRKAMQAIQSKDRHSFFCLCTHSAVNTAEAKSHALQCPNSWQQGELEKAIGHSSRTIVTPNMGRKWKEATPQVIRRLVVHVCCDIVEQKDELRKGRHNENDDPDSTSKSGFAIKWTSLLKVERSRIGSRSIHRSASVGSNETKQLSNQGSDCSTMKQIAGESLASYMPLVWSLETFQKQCSALNGTCHVYLPDENVLVYALLLQEQVLRDEEAGTSTAAPCPSTKYPLDEATADSSTEIVEHLLSNCLLADSPIAALEVCIPIRLSHTPMQRVQPCADTSSKQEMRPPDGITDFNLNGALTTFSSSQNVGIKESTSPDLQCEQSSPRSIQAFDLTDASNEAAPSGSESEGGAIHSDNPEKTPGQSVQESCLEKVADKVVSSQENSHATQRRKVYHFLVVDDERTNRMILKKMLTRRGHKVTLAKDGQEIAPLLSQSETKGDSDGFRSLEAIGESKRSPSSVNSCSRPAANKLAHNGSTTSVSDSRTETDNNKVDGRTFSTEPFDALLLDIVMHQMNGDVACRQLRRQGYTLPVIATTGNASTQDAEKYKTCGFNAVVHKPFTTETLLQALRSVGVDA